MKFTRESLLLYALTDPHWLPAETMLSQVEAALQAGITCLQLREKETDPLAFQAKAALLKPLCQKYEVPLIINDNLEIALKIKADGLHIGQEDLATSQARLLLGQEPILGVSATNLEEALAAERQGADYLGVGAMLATPSKTNAKLVSLETLQSICRAVSIPVVAIGGIEANNLLQLKNCGLAGVAVIRAIWAAAQIAPAVKQLKQLALEL